MTFYDFERDEYVTRVQLEQEFVALKESGETEAETADEYIESCMDFNDGTLELNERTLTIDYLETHNHIVSADNGNQVKRLDLPDGKYGLLNENYVVYSTTNDLEQVFDWLEI